MFGFELDETGLTIAIAYVGLVVFTLWLAMVVWTYRDMRARSRDMLAQLFVTMVVAILNVPGLLIYLFLRPRETMSEAYERSLEEEALLQEIEEKPTCPGCGQRVHDDWQVCPYCHTRLKKICVRCHKLLELSWNLCPHCAASQVGYQELESAYEPPPQQRISLTRQESPAETLEFVDGDEF